MIDYDQATPRWEDSHRYGPAPRWRRMMLRSIIRKLNPASVLDAGCAQPFLLLSLQDLEDVRLSGCDYSRPVIEQNQKLYPNMGFFVCNLSEEQFEYNERFDCVVCSEVLEHVPDYAVAIANLCRLSGKYVLVTVPAGKIRPIDKGVGHLRHFTKEMLEREFSKNHFDISYITYKGFPFHSLYKRLINIGGGTGIAERYSSAKYGTSQIILSNLVYLSFRFNIVPIGNQLIALAKRKEG